MNYRFSALITKEDDWYVARCPELSVTSQGKDVEAARANLHEAIELYLETLSASFLNSPCRPPWGLCRHFPSLFRKLQGRQTGDCKSCRLISASLPRSSKKAKLSSCMATSR